MIAKDKTNLIFVHKTIKAIADSMVKVFVPLLIYQGCQNMLFVMMYLSVLYFLSGILNIVLKKFLQKFGLVAIMLHAVPIIVVQVLLNLSMTWWICLLMAIFMAFAQALYSVPINILFSLTDKNVNVAKFEIPTNVGKIIFILLSGYVLSSSFTHSLLLMCIVSSGLYIASTIPLFFSYKMIKQTYAQAATAPSNMDKRSYRFFNLYHFLFGVFQSVIDVIVPLFLYVEKLTFQSVAIVMALIELCKIGANLLAKLLVKKNLSILSVFLSTGMAIASCVTMIFVKDPLLLYICSCCIGVSFPLLFVPLFSLYVKKIAKDNNQFDGMTYRDFYILTFREVLFLPYYAFPNLLLQLVIGIVSSAGLAATAVRLIKTKEPPRIENMETWASHQNQGED
ncbi:MAG: hypothetical protein J6K39_01925 [Clostridia bacterium]|nr:hypothetical protein [Clostridia bacterium]